MVRTHTFAAPVDTSYFTALQIQPRTALALTWNGYARWLKEYLVSFPTLIKDEKCGTVILGIEMDYPERVGFFDSDALEVEIGLRARRGGSRLALTSSFRSAGKVAVRVAINLCPLEIVDPLSLAARPAKLPPHLLAKFNADEVDEGSPERGLPQWLAMVEKGRLLCERTSGFTIHHHFCEVAEQWSFVEVAAIVEGSREPMALDEGGKHPLLRESLRKPLSRMSTELSAPYFVFEEGRVQTRAYDVDGRLHFIHRLLAAHTDDVHGTIIESFAE